MDPFPPSPGPGPLQPPACGMRCVWPISAARPQAATGRNVLPLRERGLEREERERGERERERERRERERERGERQREKDIERG